MGVYRCVHRWEAVYGDLQQMAEANEQVEIEQPEQVIEAPHHQTHPDHIPLKDEFSSDLSEIDIADLGQRQEQAQVSQRAVDRPKRKKILRTFRWKSKWVMVPNAIAGSTPILLKRWVKVRHVPSEEELVEVNNQSSNAIEIAHAIIQGQLNNQ